MDREMFVVGGDTLGSFFLVDSFWYTGAAHVLC